jgi:hypothetical protein
VTDDPYAYPGTDCLRNRLGIHDASELERVEKERTVVALALIERNPLPGRYDVAHLQAFHRRIFGDIYDWAGEIRTVVIAKEGSVFALPEHIEGYLYVALDQLAREQHLRGLDRQRFLERVTHYPLSSTPLIRSERATAEPTAPSSDNSPTKPVITSPGNGSTANAISTLPAPASMPTTARCASSSMSCSRARERATSAPAVSS